MDADKPLPHSSGRCAEFLIGDVAMSGTVKPRIDFAEPASSESPRRPSKQQQTFSEAGVAYICACSYR